MACKAFTTKYLRNVTRTVWAAVLKELTYPLNNKGAKKGALERRTTFGSLKNLTTEVLRLSRPTERSNGFWEINILVHALQVLHFVKFW